MGILTRDMVVEKVEEAARRLAEGETIILTDHEDRENEGDLICLADRITPEAVDYMALKARGLICIAMAPELVDAIGLAPQVQGNDSPFSTPFTESVDAVEGVTTGISANERAITLQLLTKPGVAKSEFSRPGHIFPLRAHPEGLFGRTGHTEGAVELAQLAGGAKAAAICEILGSGGSMARGKELEDFAETEDLFMLSMEELITYLYQPEETVEMPLAQGDFTLSVYPTRNGETEPPAVLIKDLPEKGKVTLRIHSQCLTGDSFGSRRCDCGEQLQTALKIISEEGGLLIHLPQEGRGIGLTEKIRAYKLQEQGLDTLEANIALGHAGDLRDYSSAVRILKHLGITEVELLTNNPEKAAALVEAGIKVDVRALQIPPHDRNRQYLTAKKEKMGHLLSL